jgi:DNA-binding PadR family transcriptional regulator
MRELTNLEHMLLSLLHARPASGYALRKLFVSTPVGHYSDSPGSIYPALQRLRRRGLLRPVKGQPSDGRGTQLLAVTPKGVAEMRSWLKRPVTREELQHDAAGLMLRFVSVAQMFGEPAARAFAGQMESCVQETIRALKSYLRGPGKNLPTTGRLAVEQGLEGYRALARWAVRAGNELKRS